jgi:hypothetical protein
MENMFVWVLIFAGAAIALLGLFLVASERELKNKRLEIERLAAKLDESPTKAVPAPMLLTQAVESEEVAELQAKNEELQKEIANLSAKLELSRRAIEELECNERLDQSAQADVQRLRDANEALTSEITELKERLQAGEGRASVSVTENLESTERQRQLRCEIEELQKQLTESQSKTRELEDAQQQRANDESLESMRADQQRQWETKIADLERELATTRERLGETESLRGQLTESERLRQELAVENRRHEEEIPRWQARIAEAEENRHRLSGIGAPFDALRAKHAEIAEQQNRFEEDLAAFGSLIALPVGATKQTNGAAAPTYRQTFSAPPTAANFAATPADHGATDHIDDKHDQTQTVAPEQLADEGKANKKRKRRFGLFPLGVLLTMAAAFAFGVWNTPAQRTDTHAKPAVAQALKSERPPDTAADTPPAATEAGAVQLAAKPREAVKPAAKQAGPATKPPQPPRQETKVSGTYEITRPSRVYAAPSEFSQSIGEIAQGVKVNVVNARDGWLEIHSKHGRPPGYIRTEAAARVIAQN